MRRRDIQRYQMFLRVHEFCEERPQLFPAGTVAGEVCGALAKAVSNLEPHVSKYRVRPGEARGRARKDLVDSLAAVRRCLLAADADGLLESIDFPRSCSDRELVLMARAIVHRLQGREQLFDGYGLSLEALPGRIKELETCIARTHDAASDRRADGRAIAAALASGSKAVQRLDVLVDHLHADEAILVEWTGRRRIDTSRPRRKSADS